MFRLTTQREIDDNTVLEPGLYRIYWVRNGIRQTVSRIAKKDESGLLYIGQTDVTLRKRLNEFRCSAFLNSTNHSGGQKYRTNNALQQLIRPDELFAEIFPCLGSYARETEQLQEYFQEFGEVPPLNG